MKASAWVPSAKFPQTVSSCCQTRGAKLLGMDGHAFKKLLWMAVPNLGQSAVRKGKHRTDADSLWGWCCYSVREVLLQKIPQNMCL